MIKAALRTGQLAARLKARAGRIAAQRSAVRRRMQRADWYAPAALWPDLFGDSRDGK